MTTTWGQFMTKLRSLYAEYPAASEQYESEYNALAARLAEAEQCIDAARRVMGGEGVEDQGEAWDKCLRILDAYGAAEQENEGL